MGLSVPCFRAYSFICRGAHPMAACCCLQPGSLSRGHVADLQPQVIFRVKTWWCRMGSTTAFRVGVKEQESRWGRGRAGEGGGGAPAEATAFSWGEAVDLEIT